MEYGVHLPVIALDDQPFSLSKLRSFVSAANGLGYRALSVNDHLTFPRPWLDGPTALASVLSETGEMDLFTSVILPIIRGPATTAKLLAAIDQLSNGRLTVGAGPGSSARDYEIVGIDYEERWKRLDEAIFSMRSFWTDKNDYFEAKFYSSSKIVLEPRPKRIDGPPVWIGSWGSDAGMRRVARIGDGWFASGYNTTPEGFRAGWEKLKERLPSYGKNPENFPNALATMWCFVTEQKHQAETVTKNVLGPLTGRPEEELMQRCLIGGAADCADKLNAYKQAGLQRIFIWPISNELDQIEIFHEKVVPLVALD